MSSLEWGILGLIVGVIAYKVANGTGQAIAQDIFLVIVGAVLGGSIYYTFGVAGVAGLNLGGLFFFSLLVVVAGAATLFMGYRADPEALARPAE